MRRLSEGCHRGSSVADISRSAPQDCGRCSEGKRIDDTKKASSMVSTAVIACTSNSFTMAVTRKSRIREPPTSRVLSPQAADGNLGPLGVQRKEPSSVNLADFRNRGAHPRNGRQRNEPCAPGQTPSVHPKLSAHTVLIAFKREIRGFPTPGSSK